MEIQVRAYTRADLPDLIRIWNEVVEDGVAFPQENYLDAQTGAARVLRVTCYVFGRKIVFDVAATDA